jgi:hypothetical protein
MALIELVDFNLNLLGEKEAAKAKTRRGRRGGVKKAAEETVATATGAAKAPRVKKDKVAETVAPAAPTVEEVKEEAAAGMPEPAEEYAETPEQQPEDVQPEGPEAEKEEEPKA